MSSLPEHHTRTCYPSAAAAIADALRLHRELLTVLNERNGLFIDPHAVEFLAQRSEQLLVAALQATESEDR